MSEARITRRNFLQQTGSAAAGVGLGLAVPTILGQQAVAAPETVPNGKRIRLGFIGVANQGTNNLKAYFKQPLADVVAVCDVDRNFLAKAKALVEEQTGHACAAYSDYRKMLESKDIDAVVITTPDHWHALPTIHACEAGKDVFCEKPLSLTIAEGRAMVNAARKHKRIVQTGSQQRSDAKFRRACELVRSGRIGKIHTVKVGIPGVNMKGPAAPDTAPPPELDYDFWLGPAPKRPYNPNRVHYYFRFFWDYSGGQMTNWGAHHLDIAQWGLGKDDSGPTSAEGTAKFHEEGLYEVPRTFEITYKYADGVTLLCGCGEGFRNGTTFEGDKGTIFVTRGKLEASDPAILETPLTERDVRLYVSENHHRNWLECIQTRKLPICDVEIGHRSATVCHLGNMAIRSGRKVVWDPKKEQVIGDAAQAEMVSRPYRAPWRLPKV